MKSSIETRKLSQNPDDTGGGKKEVKKVVDTIEFIGGSGVDQEYIKAVKELFSKLPEDSSLRDSVFVMAEIENEKYRFLQDFGGITEATDILVKNPNKKVLLFSTLKLDTLKRLKPD